MPIWVYCLKINDKCQGGVVIFGKPLHFVTVSPWNIIIPESAGVDWNTLINIRLFQGEEYRYF